MMARPEANAAMIECPYCYSPVKPGDTVCPHCGREIERWQTGFYTRQRLPTRSRTAVWVGAALALLVLLAGFARACKWI
jgi:DNA-directed RNA polymerase subunit RPC12/RpoP